MKKPFARELKLTGMAIMLIALTLLTSQADYIVLNEEGEKNLAALEEKMAPVKALTGAFGDHWDSNTRRISPSGRMIRCVIIGARPARNLTISYQSIEGSPEYDFIAFDASGEKRSRKTTISQFWIKMIHNEFDSDLDIRTLFSDRDEVMGIGLGSRKYFALARRAVDPTGALGFYKPGESLPDDAAGVKEGALIHSLKNPSPVWDEKHRARIRQAQIQEETRMLQIAKARIPTAHLFSIAGVNSEAVFAYAAIGAIARERRYSLSRTGFDQKALGSLVFVLDLATIKDTEPRSIDNAVHMMVVEGQFALKAAIECIRAAMPGRWSHCDGPKAISIWEKYMTAEVGEPQFDRAALTDEYHSARQQARSGDGLCRPHNSFCSDPSELAEVALDALLLTDGLYTLDGGSLAGALLPFLYEPTGLNPRRNDRINLRDSAFKLLVHLLSPDKPDGQKMAINARRELRGSFLPSHEKLAREGNGSLAAVRAIFNAAGWGSADDLKDIADEQFSVALSGHSGGHTDEWVVIATTHLHAISQLQDSKREAERNAAQRVRNRVAELQARRAKPKAGEKLDKRDERFLQIWDTLDQQNKPKER